MTRVAARGVDTQASGAERVAIFESIEDITVFIREAKWLQVSRVDVVGDNHSPHFRADPCIEDGIFNR